MGYKHERGLFIRNCHEQVTCQKNGCRNYSADSGCNVHPLRMPAIRAAQNCRPAHCRNGTALPAESAPPSISKAVSS